MLSIPGALILAGTGRGQISHEWHWTWKPDPLNAQHLTLACVFLLVRAENINDRDNYLIQKKKKECNEFIKTITYKFSLE